MNAIFIFLYISPVYVSFSLPIGKDNLNLFASDRREKQVE